MNKSTPQNLTIRVYYEDTDAGGIVYHAAYLRFAERGRTEFVRNLGIDQQKMRSDLGLGFVVTSLSIDYLKPAYLDDRLTVTTEIALVRPASVNFNQTVAREDQILANLKVRVACLDADGNPVRLPTALTTTP
ncbi:MAG: tol-pal system-associated acyl-CoA thioesterase [Rhodospirillales bacterium]|jgi:acyl-CoA thioester hydrolase